ncbi:MAG: hypothetical protein ABJE95_18015 [Byssovorax sp.]
MLIVALGLTTTACTALEPDFGALVVREDPAPDGGAAGDAGGISFARDIRPILAREPDSAGGPGCKKCHYSTQSEHIGYDLGALDLATLGALRKGGTTGGARIVIPGDPEGSVIIQKLEGTYGYGARMPRSGPPYLRPEEIDLVKSWILDGAKGDDSE